MIKKNMCSLLVATLCLIALATGCSSGDSVERIKVQGKVSLDGEPLKSGSITFLPINNGISTGASIVDGEYFIDSKDGATEGEYKVEIDLSQPSGKKVPGFVEGSLEDEYVNVIPEVYNRKTTLRVMIKNGDENKHDFDLKRNP
tara:strand:+ start:20 stop:451 length:432 start_codon:yes stop_codon:yes gene_type:complete